MTTTPQWAKDAADAVFGELGDRSGFDHWWGNIDEDTSNEILDAVAASIAAAAPPHPASGVAVVTEAMVEIGARAVCAHMGCDADEPATYERSRKKCCRPDGSVILQWELHAPEVRAALEAALGAREGK